MFEESKLENPFSNILSNFDGAYKNNINMIKREETRVKITLPSASKNQKSITEYLKK